MYITRYNKHANICINKQLKMNNLKEEYTIKFFNNVQRLVAMRKSMRVTQLQIAFESKVSIRTIQNFEAYECSDYYLIYAYSQVLNK